MKKIFDIIKTKYLNIICYAISIIFLLYAISFVFISYSKERSFQAKINAMIEYCNQYNENIDKDIDNSFCHEDNENQLYTDGKTAFIDAYNKSFITSNSYKVITDGKIKISTFGGLFVDVDYNFTIEKYSDNHCYEEIVSGVIDSNAPSFILSGVFNGLKRINVNNIKRVVTTDKVQYVGRNLVADYTNKYPVTTNENFFYDNLYIVNEDTVLEITYFKVNKKNGKIVNYYVQATLNPILATENYKKIIEPAVNNPKFKNVVITLIIDNNGYVSALNSIEYVNGTLAGFSSSASVSMMYSISNINEIIETSYEDYF